MKRSCSRILTMTGRNVKEILRDPLSLVFTVALPLVMEILFYLIFHDLTSQFEMRYLAPGIVVFGQSFLALFTGLLISLDRATSFLTRLFVSKARPYEFILSYALSVLPIALFQSILFFDVGGIFDPSLLGVSMLAAILLSLFTSLFFIAAGILFGSLCSEKAIGGVCSIVIAGQSVLSGMWFPLEGMNATVLTVMKVLPFRNAFLLVQNALCGIENAFDDFLMPLLVVAAYTLALFTVAVIVFKRRMTAK